MRWADVPIYVGWQGAFSDGRRVMVVIQKNLARTFAEIAPAEIRHMRLNYPDVCIGRVRLKLPGKPLKGENVEF